MVCVYDSRHCKTPRPAAVAGSVAAANAPLAGDARAERLAARVAALKIQCAALRRRNQELAGENRHLQARLNERETQLRHRAERRDLVALAAARDQALLEAIKKIVARHSGIRVAALVGQRRGRLEAWPRQMLCFLAREHCAGLSLPRIGAAINRDHTTILHAVRAVTARLAAGEATTVALHGACLGELEQARAAVYARYAEESDAEGAGDGQG